jgi:hypothetical protein
MKKRTKKLQLKSVKLREFWTIKPITQIKQSDKLYSRKRAKRNDAEERNLPR